MFPLGGGELVFGDDGPAVSTVDEDLPSTHVNHRLNGENHAGDEEHARAFLAVVQHLGVVVELDTHTVAAEVAHNAEAVLMSV